MVLALVLLCLAAVAFIVERQLASFEFRGSIASEGWIVENNNINQENYQKMLNAPTAPLFRSRGYLPPPVTPGRQRLLVIGDSFIWGDGLTNINMIWWRQLQWELERRGYHSVDVIAAGLNGASTQDQLRWLREDLLNGEADNASAIIFGYVTNDPSMAGDDGKMLVPQLNPGAIIGDGVESRRVELPLLEKLFPNLAFQLSARMTDKRALRDFDASQGYPYNLWELQILQGENFARYEAMLKDLNIKLNELAVPAFFVTTPNTPVREYFEPRYKPVLAAFARAGITIHDLFPDLVRSFANESGALILAANPANGHPGPRMTHYYAVKTADILERDFPAVLGERTDQLPAYVPQINDWLPADVQPRKVAADRWEIDIPEISFRPLNLPLEVPHIALNFERPVRISNLRLQGPENTHYALWLKVLDSDRGFEIPDYVPMGEADGASAVFTLPAHLAASRITSLRLAVNPSRSVADDAISLDGSLMQHELGKAYKYPLPALVTQADSMTNQTQSNLVLFEDGLPLARAHSMHASIRDEGGGRYSHWQDYLLFSASDGSDPQTNGRQYSLKAATSWPLQLQIDFGMPAVEP